MCVQLSEGFKVHGKTQINDLNDARIIGRLLLAVHAGVSRLQRKG